MRLLIFLLKCVVGLFAAIGFLTLALFVLIGVVASKGERWQAERIEVPEQIVLTVDVSDGLVEVQPDNPFARASLGNVLVVREVVETLEQAGQDPRVKGLLLHVGMGRLGMGQLQELRQALADFRATGKPVTAFARSFGEGGDGTLHYYLASAADEIWLQPSGDLDMTGFQIESPFLKAALERIGVEPQIDQREDYKGAMNALTDTALPAPQRENLQRLLDSWLGQVAAGVGAARDLAPDQVHALIDRAPLSGATALEAGLIDHLGYWDQMTASLFEPLDESADYLSYSDYRATRPAQVGATATVALIVGEGPVALGESDNDPVFGDIAMGADTVAKAIGDALDDAEVEAILFRVNSPGGSYVASDAIWREVQRARDQGKPLIVSMGNLAASGGYFVAAPAHKIVAQPGTVTGSIGVVGGKLAITGLWDHLSINWDGVKAGANADIWSANRTFSPAQWAHLSDSLDRVYADFTAKVGAGRGLGDAEVLAAAQGQIWSGEDAKARGLVDELGGFKTALALAKEAAGIDPEATVWLKAFPEPLSPFDFLVKDLMSGNVEGALAGQLSRLARALGALAPLLEALERFGPDGRLERLRAPDLEPRR